MCRSADSTSLLIRELYIGMEIAATRNVTDCEVRAACWNSSLCCTAGRDLPRNVRKTAGERAMYRTERERPEEAQSERLSPSAAKPDGAHVRIHFSWECTHSRSWVPD